MNIVPNDHSEEWMQKRLLALRDVSGLERSPDAEKTGRVRFLNEAASLPAHSSYRQNLWGTSKSFVSGRPVRLALSAAAAVCVVLALLLVGSGTVVYAAQGSQPDQILYPVKLLSEDVRLSLAVNPQSQFQLNLAFADRRLGEIDKLAQAGQDAGTQVTDRLKNELNAALDSAASLDNPGAVKALENLQANLLQHQAQLLKLQSQANPRAVANYARVVEMLQQKLSLAQQGIKDPQLIHQLLKQEKKQDKKLSGDTPTPTAEMNNVAEATITPAIPSVTEPENQSAKCNGQTNNNNSNGNGNGKGNGSQCDEPDTQVTAAPVHPAAAVNTPKPDNPNKPEKTPKKPPDKGNKGGNGQNK